MDCSSWTPSLYVFAIFLRQTGQAKGAVHGIFWVALFAAQPTGFSID
jgi:hypothetical protein